MNVHTRLNGLLITVGGVGGIGDDLSQTAYTDPNVTVCIHDRSNTN